MVDVFDMNIGGYGFHITSHMIALVALFIACFAIAGYINFRSGSIPSSALKENNDIDVRNLELDTVAYGPDGTGRYKEYHTVGYYNAASGTVTQGGNSVFMVTSPAANATTRLTLPAGAFIQKATALAQTGLTYAGNGGNLDIGVQNAGLATAGAGGAGENETLIFDGTLSSGGGQTVGALTEALVSVYGTVDNNDPADNHADVQGAFGSAGVTTGTGTGTGTSPADVILTAVTQNLTGGTVRVDIWYMIRD